MADTHPNLGYGQQSEATIDQVNIWMRSTPWYQQQMRAWGQDPGHPTLTKSQSQQILRMAQANGVVVDEGNMEVDDHGNFNPQGHKLRNTLIVAGIAAAAIGTMGAAGVFAGAGGAAAGTGGAAAGTLGSTTIGTGMVGGIAGGTGLGAGAAGTLGATAIGAGGVGGMTGGTGIAGGITGGTGAAGAGGAGSSLFGLTGRDYANVGLNVFDSLFSAHTQSDAAKYAADLQSKANADALAFAKSQAENAYQNNEVARQGNYGQWAARENRIGNFGSLVGLPGREIPAYVPGVDPNFTGSQPGTAGPRTMGSLVNGPTSGPNARGTQADLQALLASGVSPQQAAQQFNQQFGRTTGNEAVYYGDSGTVSIPEGYFSNGATGWRFAPRGAAAPPAAKTPYTVSQPAAGTLASYLPAPVVPVSPALQMPQVAYQPHAFGSLVNNYV